MPAIGEPYISVTEMKDYLYSGKDQKDQTDRHDAKLEGALKSVSKEVNLICGRQFNKADEASERAFGFESIRRYKDARGVWRYKLLVSDFYSLDDLMITIDGTVVTDAVLLPRNGLVNDEPGWPYCEILHDSITVDSEIDVTAKWGWAAVPDDIIEAIKIATEQNYSLTRGMNGIAGISPMGHGITLRDNALAMAKLKRYRRNVVFFRGANG